MDENQVTLSDYIKQSTPYAKAIFYDMRYDIDSLAGVRSSQRLNSIDVQLGAQVVFGILGYWALDAQDIFRTGTGQEPEKVVVFLPKTLDNKASAETIERARLSATQFVNCLANDDLDMAEAIYMAARDSSPEDAAALVSVLLCMYINVSEQFLED